MSSDRVTRATAGNTAVRAWSWVSVKQADSETPLVPHSYFALGEPAGQRRNAQFNV
jgi:hypothetical protein